MLNLIIFSKNRSYQLDATIRSSIRGCFNSISVVYFADEEHQKGYDILIKEYPNINFIKQTNFKQDILNCFKDEYTCFAADDDIFIKDFNKALLKEITDDVICFSLRLGLNIDYCYSNDKPNKIKTYEDRGEFIKWNWRDEELDFAYPLSVISHIFRTKEIKELTEKIDFENPNTYEGNLQIFLKDLKPKMVAYKHSRVFGVPANSVNSSWTNRNGLIHAYSIKELNDRFLRGERINLDREFNIHSAQQEYEI